MFHIAWYQRMIVPDLASLSTLSPLVLSSLLYADHTQVLKSVPDLADRNNSVPLLGKVIDSVQKCWIYKNTRERTNLRERTNSGCAAQRPAGCARRKKSAGAAMKMATGPGARPRPLSAMTLVSRWGTQTWVSMGNQDAWAAGAAGVPGTTRAASGASATQATWLLTRGCASLLHGCIGALLGA